MMNVNIKALLTNFVNLTVNAVGTLNILEALDKNLKNLKLPKLKTNTIL